MKIEVSYYGVGRNRVYFATKAGAGRPRKHDKLDDSSKKEYVTGSSRKEAVDNFLDYINFSPAQR